MFTTQTGKAVSMQVAASPMQLGGIVLVGQEVGRAHDPELNGTFRNRVSVRANEPSSVAMDLASLSHELRTPLNGLFGALDLALHGSRKLGGGAAVGRRLSRTSRRAAAPLAAPR